MKSVYKTNLYSMRDLRGQQIYPKTAETNQKPSGNELVCPK